jgi:hypothetical protein
MTTVDGSDVTAPEGATVHELTVLRSLSASCFTSPMTSALKRIGTCVDSVCAARRRPGPAGVRLSGSA